MSFSAGIAWIKRVLRFDVNAAHAAQPQAAAPPAAKPAKRVRFAPELVTPPAAPPAAPIIARNYSTVEDASEPAPAPPPAVARPPARKQFAPVNTTPTPSGMKTKRVGAEYAGEHNSAAWRDRDNKLGKAGARLTTKLFDDKEQADGTLSVGPEGRFVDGRGPVAAVSTNFTMGEDGRMVGFENTVEIMRRRKSGKPGKVRKGNLKEGMIAVVKHRRAEARSVHHSSALGGEAATDGGGQPLVDAKGRPVMQSKPAALAGSVEFDNNGRLVRITNLSGHYKPDVDFLIQGVEFLLKQGAFFDGEITDADGNPLDKDGQLYRLYSATQEKLKTRDTLLTRIQDVTASLAETGGNGKEKESDDDPGLELVELRQELIRLNGDLDAAQKVLRKAGVGPSQRVSPAKAAFFDSEIGAMTGPQIGNANAADRKRNAPGANANPQLREMEVDDFLRSGGGSVNKRTGRTNLAHKQDAVQIIGGEEVPEGATTDDALLAVKLRARRESLDRDAEERARRLAPKPSPRKAGNIDALLDRLGAPPPAAAPPPPPPAPAPVAAPPSPPAPPQPVGGDAPTMTLVYAVVPDRQKKGKGKGKGKAKARPTEASAVPSVYSEPSSTLPAKDRGKAKAKKRSGSASPEDDEMPTYRFPPTDGGEGKGGTKTKGRKKQRGDAAPAQDGMETHALADGEGAKPRPTSKKKASAAKSGKKTDAAPAIAGTETYGEVSEAADRVKATKTAASKDRSKSKAKSKDKKKSKPKARSGMEGAETYTVS